MCFFHRILNSLLAGLRLGRSVNQSKKETLLTNWQSLEVLLHSFGSKGAHEILRNGNFGGTIADRDLHSNAISFFDLCGLADLIPDSKVVAPTAHRIEA